MPMCRFGFVLPMDDDYSTIEHDFLHVKDYFSNYKFTYKERRSKLDFLLNISNEPSQDISELIASSKEQLVEVKNVYKNIDEEIKDLSVKIYKEQMTLKKNTDQFKQLEANEELLQERVNHLKNLHEKILVNDKLNEELEQIEQEVNTLFVELETKRALLDAPLTEAKTEEEQSLREIRNDLAAKQKRLTIINTENYMEDIFYWEKQYLGILEKIFGSVNVSVVDDRCNLKVTKNNNVLEINTKGKKLLDCIISRSEADDEFDKIKEYCLSINDPKLVLMYFASKY